MQPVEYVIFDLDGLLIIYTDVTNQILSRYGKEMTMDIKAGLMGKPERAAAEHLLSYFPDIDLTVELYIQERRKKQDALWPTVMPLPGVLKLLHHLHSHSIPMAIATGSQKRSVVLKTSHLPQMLSLFGGNIICADDVEHGKPCPDVFLAAADLLERRVGEGDYTTVDEATRLERLKGLVLEDAIPGVQAGIRAGMQVVWVPDVRLTALEEGQGLEVQQTLTSLEEFEPERWGLPPYPKTSVVQV
ncbi:HAD-like protein [Ramaria rubella]|nr:HAD-like protein [Ramaria rubella]